MELSKFNEKLLTDEYFVEKVKESLWGYNEDDGCWPFEKWEIFKEEIMQIAIKRSSEIVIALRRKENLYNTDCAFFLTPSPRIPGTELKIRFY